LNREKHELDRTSIETGSGFSDPFSILQERVEAPAGTQDEFTRIKKDFFTHFETISCVGIQLSQV